MAQDILFPVDLAHPESWQHALPQAIKLAEGGALHILTVIPNFGMAIVGGYFDEGFIATALEETGRELTNWVNENVPKEQVVHPHVVHGKIYDEIIRAADRLEVPIIVMGAPKPNVSEYLLGPNAARVVRHANQSVFIVRD